VGLNIIQIAIPLILVILEWILTIVQKKDITTARHHIRYIYRACKCRYSALLKIGIFGVILFFYNIVPWSIPREWWAYSFVLLL
jgi:hypothetical protein